MNYTQTLEFLFQSLPAFETKGATAYKPGLERITAFCRHIGNPQRNFFTIHVAGTNGKGSVSHIIASVLQQAGYRTGLFTSPHLQDFRERIRVDGEMIPKQKVVNFVDKHHDKMVELELSFFEMTAALAFDYFAQSDVEVAVIETGLGGRLDATNIIVPVVSVITNIGLEHTALLGDTLQKIAAEKAGADYIGTGAVFGSTTKKDAKYLSMEDLKKIAASVSIPVVAIGGINSENVSQLEGSGVNGAAVISGIFAAEDPAAKTAQMSRLTDIFC